MLLIQPPALAQTEAGWRTATGENYCDISFHRDPTMILMIRDFGGAEYSLSGEALRMARTGRSVPGDIRIIAGSSEMLLFGSEAAMREQAQTTRKYPIDLFLTALGDGDEFTLQTEAGAEQIPLAGFAAAAEEFGRCSADNAGLRGPRAPIMTAFDGLQKLRAEASRQRLLSGKLGYILTIDAQGKPTDCELTRTFRRRATELALCRPMLEHTTFEPALDAEANPIAGIFEIEIDFDMWMTQKGYLEAEDR